MPQYLVAIHHPDNYDPSARRRGDGPRYRCAQRRDGGCRCQVLRPAALQTSFSSRRKSLRKQSGGEVVITDGPYLETKEHIGGFWILDAANMDEACGVGTQSRCRLRPEHWRGALPALRGRPGASQGGPCALPLGAVERGSVRNAAHCLTTRGLGFWPQPIQKG